MSEELFTTTIGFGIENEDTGLNSYEEFPVSGVPGSAGLSANQLSLSDNAPIGSKAVNILTGFTYRKKTVGGGETTWTREATIDDIDAAHSSDSWRDPAKVKDDTAYASLASAETAVNTGTIDGVATIADGDRILFTNITGEGKNVFIVTGTVGAGATLVEDTNAESNNDVLLIDSGTVAGNEFHYNSVTDSWVQSNNTASNEDGFQNTYVGKPGTGSQTTSYTSQTVVTNGDSLTVAIGKLDAESDAQDTALTNQASSLANLQTEVDGIETAMGAVIDVNGDYAAHSGSNYIDGNTNVTEDLTDLDTQVKANADAITAQGGAASTLGVTALTTVDSILVDDVKMARWMVHIQQGTKVKTFEVDATHNGTSSSDASQADFTKYARLKIGGVIAGLKLRVALTGVGVTQSMILTVEASAAVDVHTTRHQVV